MFEMNLVDEDFSFKLVQEVEKFPVLYDYNLADYSKRDAVDAAWDQVTKSMNGSGSNVTVTICKEKWRNIRTVLARKLKGQGSGRSRTRPYYLIDSLQFLIPFVGGKKWESCDISPENEIHFEQNLDLSEGVSGDDWNLEEDLDSVPEDKNYNKFLVHKKRKILKRSGEVGGEPPPFLKYVEPTQNVEEENSRRMFLMSLLPDVQKLTHTKMRKFRKHVVNILDVLLDDEPNSVSGSSSSQPKYEWSPIRSVKQEPARGGESENQNLPHGLLEVTITEGKNVKSQFL